MSDDPCPECKRILGSQDWFAIRGACASIGIERGMTTDEVMVEYMARLHRREHVR